MIEDHAAESPAKTDLGCIHQGRLPNAQRFAHHPSYEGHACTGPDVKDMGREALNVKDHVLQQTFRALALVMGRGVRAA
jgi:hypothetical protein